MEIYAAVFPDRKEMMMRIVLSVLSMCFSLAAAAAGNEWYLGAGVGESWVKNGCSTMPANPHYSCDDDSTAWNIYLGRRFTKSWAAELGYVEIGKARTIGAVELEDGRRALPAPAFIGQVLYPASGRWEARGVDFSAIVNYPLPNKFALIGKIGLLLWDAEYATDIPGDHGYDKRGMSPAFGAGIGFAPNERVSFRIMGVKYLDVDRGDVDVLNMAIMLHF